MKRSEAIKILTEIIGRLDLDADQLLDFIEKDLGMMPPITEDKVKAEEQEDGSVIITLWKWDDEDGKV